MLWLAFTGRITNANSKEIMVIIDKNLFILQTLLLLYKIAFYVDKPHLLTGIKSPTFQNQLLYIIYKNQLAKIYFISISSSDKLILSNYISNVNTKDNYFLYCAFNMQCLLTHLYFCAICAQQTAHRDRQTGFHHKLRSSRFIKSLKNRAVICTMACNFTLFLS